MTALASRWELLGLELSGVLWLAGDLWLLLAGAILLGRHLAGARRGSAREHVGIALVAIAAVVLPATALGACGVLSNVSMVAVHGALAVVAVAANRRQGWLPALRATAAAPLEWCGSLARIPRRLLAPDSWRRRRWPASALLAAILVVLAFYAFLAVGTLPLGYDAQTYRLTRVAIWLQEGSLAHFATNELRQNFVGQNADLVTLWLLSFFRSGFPLAQVAQYLAGLIACAAVYEFGRLLGWRRLARLAAVAALLGAPNVSVQFFSTQTDLFVAAMLAAGTLFALVALRSGRAGDWLLAGIGAGLGVGTKATALFLGPSVALLLVAFALGERRPWAPLARGWVLASVPALLLCGFNFGQNIASYGHPLAPSDHFRTMRGGGAKSGLKTVRNLERFAWQVLEPASNPLVPEAVRAPLFERLSARLSADPGAPGWYEANQALIDGRLDEDHASFGLIWLLAVFAGGGLACAQAIGKPARRRIGALALFVSFVVFLLVFARYSTMNVHQFRYFVIAAPFGAVVAASFSATRGRFARAFGGLLATVHLLTAGLVGARSEYQGWGSLRDPQSSLHFPLWRHRRALVESLGDVPLRIGVAPPYDGWVAAYLRTRTAHRFRIVRYEDLAALPSLGELFANGELELLIAAPGVLERFMLDDVAIRPSPRSEWAPQIAVAPLGPGEGPRPVIVSLAGVHDDGWTRSAVWIGVANWGPESLRLSLRNPTPLERRMEVTSSLASRQSVIAPRSLHDLEVDVSARDTVKLAIDPAYVPGDLDPMLADSRRLGLLVQPSRVLAESGVFADRWTAPQAVLTLENWLSGIFTVALENATPLPRSIRLAGGHEARTIELAPFARASASLAVLPRDRLTLEVAPPFVPSRHDPTSADERQLGVLLDADLLRAPRPGEFR